MADTPNPPDRFSLHPIGVGEARPARIDIDTSFARTRNTSTSFALPLNTNRTTFKKKAQKRPTPTDYSDFRR